MKNIALPVSLALLAIGCTQEVTESNLPDAEEGRSVAVEFDATQITQALATTELPIIDVVTVTAETDGNNQLGRPGGYLSKAYFKDSRHPNAGSNPDQQNTIEVFASTGDATSRREYVEKVTADMPMLRQYIIQRGAIVLRLDKAITPDQARTYEEALNAI